MVADPRRSDTGTSLVSVIIPVFNGQDIVGETISSALRQSYPNLEVLVVDDGSTDATPDILEAYGRASRAGRIIRTFRQQNTGCGGARNLALAEATGDYITFCDADDYLLPQYVQRLLDFRNLNPGAREIVWANSFQMTQAGIREGRPVYRERMPPAEEQRTAILQHNIGSLNGLFPRAFFEEVGVFDPDQAYVEDWELWLRGVFSGWTFRRFEENNAVLTWSSGSMQNNREGMAQGERQALEKTLARFRSTMSPSEIRSIERRLAVGSPLAVVSEMEQALREGRLKDARRNLELATDMMSSQRRLRAKAAIGRLPGGMRVLQGRQRVIDGYVGYDDSMRR